MQEDLLAAIETLYDCADTHFDYQRAVSTLSRQTDDTGFMIGKLSLPGKITSYAYTNVPDGAIEAVTRKRWSRDNHKFIKLFPYLPVGMPVLRRTMHSDEDCHQTELWRTTCRPWGIHSEGTCILKRGLFGGEAMSFVRLPGQEEIDHDLLSRMILLIKHLRRAMLLHARVSMVEEALIMSNKALDLMEHGLVLLADDGEMLFVNSAAERIFDAGDGLSLRNNSIAIANADAKEKFCAMMEKVMQPGIPLSMRAGGYVKVPRKSFGRPYGLMAVPLPRTSSADLDAVGTAIFVFDPNTTKTTASDFFASAFDLTPAEAQLATELAQGASLEDYARGKGITRNTVKTQLKFLFAKTGTSRQSELVGVLLRSVSGINLKL